MPEKAQGNSPPPPPPPVTPPDPKATVELRLVNNGDGGQAGDKPKK